MYWQNRFERENPDEKLEKEILDIRKVHKDYVRLCMLQQVAR